MAYVALYRKWRPASFDELVGQEAVSRTLSNAIESGRIGHAYLFSGPRGTGKTSTAKILAKSLNCQNGPTLHPCNSCDSCRSISDGSAMDVREIDAASNRGIDEIRDLRETVKFAPQSGHYKVYIIDEVHMLTTEAFNALLKTLEEPPERVLFILATTEAHKVPATIQSRCQRYDFRRITVDDIYGRLKLVMENMQVPAEPEALRMIAVQADGGMRDALSILDQCAALMTGDTLTAETVQQLLGLIGKEWVNKLADAIAARRAADILHHVDELLKNGKDLQQLLSELAMHFRSLMIYQAAGTIDGTELYTNTEEVLRHQSKMFSHERIMAVISRLHEAMNEIKWSPQPRITVEAVLLELCHEPAVLAPSVADAPVQTSQDDERIAKLEARLSQMARAVEKLKELGAGAAPAQLKKTVAVSKPLPPPASKAYSFPAPDAAAQNVWRQLQEKASGPLLASLGNARLLGMDDRYFGLVFSKAASKMVVEKMNRKSIEGYLLEITGKPLGLYCSLNEHPSDPPPPPLQKKHIEFPEFEDFTSNDIMGGDVDLDNLSEEELQRLQAAQDIFGGHIMEIPPEEDFE